MNEIRKIRGSQSLGNSAEARKDTSPMAYLSLATTVKMCGQLTQFPTTAEVYFINTMYIADGQSNGVFPLTVGLKCPLYCEPEQGSIPIFPTSVL
jgi:hypothetical protein